MKPKFFTTIKNYSIQDFIGDFTAGIIVAIVALPLSIALAIASGVSPEKGLHTAIIAGFIISFLGGSRVQIGGPTGAFMIIVYRIITQYGFDGLIIATIMGGLVMVLMGVFKLGVAIKFIPHTITTGFTSGIAITIFSSQINDFLGLNLSKMPPDFIGKWILVLSNLGKINIVTLFTGTLALLIIIFWDKSKSRIPGTMVALVVTTLLVKFLNLDVMTIGTKFGELSSALPALSLPTGINMEKIRMLIAPACTIAILGSIESLMSAVVADGMIGGRHRSNTELIAQGIANIFSGLFGGIPATGAIARTVTNINNGGRTPMAGMVHSGVLLVVMLVFMPFARMIPLSALAAVLIIVAYNMSGWRDFYALLKSPKSDVAVLILTFLITVFIDLVVAISVGMVLAAFLFMKRMADLSSVKEITKDYLEEEDSINSTFNYSVFSEIPKSVQVYEINGAMFFGVVDKFLEVVKNTNSNTKVIILRLKNVPTMDATAVHAIRRFVENSKRLKLKLIFTGLKDQPYEILDKVGILDNIGKENIFDYYDEALVHLKSLELD